MEQLEGFFLSYRVRPSLRREVSFPGDYDSPAAPD